MTILKFKSQTSVIIAAEPVEFIDTVAHSDFAFTTGKALVPIQSRAECLRAVEQEHRCLIVIDPRFVIKDDQFELIRRGIARGAKWCSLRTYKNHLREYTEITEFRDLLDWLEHTNDIAELPLLAKCQCLARRIAASLLLILLSPLFLMLAIAIKTASPGPVIYRQTRVGFRGKTFQLFKFRSMHEDAESRGPQWSTGDKDPRTFAFGKFLRKSHLDELPQLWNILKGELCFIGPRPERPEFHKLLETEIPHFDSRTRVKPGITGWAQLRAGYASSVEDCRKKVAHDLFFIRNSSISMNLKIMYKTIEKMTSEITNFVLTSLVRTRTKSN